MPAFFMTFLACALVTLAGREQVRVARLSAALGPGAGLVAAIAFSTLIASAFAAWIGQALAPAMSSAPARQMFVALALLLAALEILLLRAPARPREPTRSTGAIALVLLAAQITDAARFLVLAMSVFGGNAVLAAAGGCAGSLSALMVAVLVGKEWEATVPVRMLAKVIAGVLALAALLIGLSARNIIF